MKLEIYEPRKTEETEPVRLKLRQSNSDIVVSVVDKNGNLVDRGNLLCFTQNGKIYLSGNVNPSLGFKLDTYKHIMVENL